MSVEFDRVNNGCPLGICNEYNSFFNTIYVCYLKSKKNRSIKMNKILKNIPFVEIIAVLTMVLNLGGCTIPPPPPNHVPLTTPDDRPGVVNYPALTPAAKQEIDQLFPHNSLPNASAWIGNIISFEQGLQSIFGVL